LMIPYLYRVNNLKAVTVVDEQYTSGRRSQSITLWYKIDG
jgi:hypothetical protein